MIKPTIGRKLWFWETREQFEAGQALQHDHCNSISVVDQPKDATVVAVWNETLVNLYVVDHDGAGHAETSVVLVQEGDLVPETRFATWMPFQVGQARQQKTA
jgi:hypothetical protein